MLGGYLANAYDFPERQAFGQASMPVEFLIRRSQARIQFLHERHEVPPYRQEALDGIGEKRIPYPLPN